MRRLDVDDNRDGSGAKVGTLSITVPGAYCEPARVLTKRVEVSAEEAAHLAELQAYAEMGQRYPLVMVPRELFLKLAQVWRLP